MSFSKIGLYEGWIVKNNFHGAIRLIIDEEVIYTGKLKNNIMHGEGKIIMLNGDQYDGDWFNG